MIEIIKCIFGIIILVGIYNQVENKPFKFEKFESGEEATKYLRKQTMNCLYPLCPIHPCNHKRNLF